MEQVKTGRKNVLCQSIKPDKSPTAKSPCDSRDIKYISVILDRPTHILPVTSRLCILGYVAYYTRDNYSSFRSLISACRD